MNELLLNRKQIFTYSDLDANDNILPKSLLQAFQNIAGEHADLIGIGYQTLLAKDYAWVIDKIKYEVADDFNPSSFEEYNLITWPQKQKILEFDREYQIKNSDGTTLVKATSKWCIINIKTRRLVRIRDIGAPQDGYLEEINFEKPYDVLIPFDTSSLVPVISKPVLFTEFDHNKHMNNCQYSSLAIDSIPNIQNYKVKAMQVNFLKECQLGDTIETFVKQVDGKKYQVLGIKNKAESSFIALIEMQ